ncbi:MAG: alpha/beta fold hydrolase [Candidatus Thorarchaeota archaeon]|nr:alpha/beta fold hydrolase [Candidatus Thorarchaeota archaeon]
MGIFQLIKSSRKAKTLLVGVVILVVGVVSTYTLTFNADINHPYTIRHYTLESGDGVLIQALVYTPVDTSSNCPGVVVGHGFCENKQYMQPLSIELVKRGFVVVNIDFRGHGSSGGYLSEFGRSNGLVLDMLAGVSYLEDLGFVDRIGLAGHSMGGGTSMLTALQNPTMINATVAIGALSTFSSSGNISDVRNLLAAFAQYDQGISRDDGLNFLRSYTGSEDVEIGTLYGSFASGTATKVSISPFSEHLMEPIDSTIIYEAVQWFESAFNGAPASDVHITAQYLITSLITTLIGLLLVLFTFISYLGSYVFKAGQVHSRPSMSSERFPFRPILAYMLAAFIGFVLLIPLSAIFVDVAPITMFNSVFGGQAVGLATGVVLVLLFSSYNNRKLQLGMIMTRIKEMSLTSPIPSLLYGLIAGLVSIAAFIAAFDWSIVASLPTIRETGVIFSLTFLLFPFFFLKEFYLRGSIQERLRYSSRIKEYFVMLVIAILIDVFIFFPVMMIGWQSVSLSFVALALTAVTLFIIFQQVLTTWVYMNSGRNVLGSTVFYCILFAWMVICFYPFGQPMMLL